MGCINGNNSSQQPVIKIIADTPTKDLWCMSKKRKDIDESVASFGAQLRVTQ